MYYSPFIVNPLSISRINELMIKFLEKAQPEVLTGNNPLDTEKLLERDLSQYTDYQLDLVHELPDGVEAQTCPQSKRVIFTLDTFSSLVQGNKRARFTAAHEVAHVLLHGEQLQNGSVQMNRAQEKIPIYQQPEWQANTGAGALLMPSEALKLLLQTVPRQDLVTKMTKVFEVSRKAAEVRLEQIKKIADYKLLQ